MRPETFSGEPYLVGSAAWRCRLHKRAGGGAYYRQVLGKPAWLDAATVVLRTRKAHLAELFQGELLLLLPDVFQFGLECPFLLLVHSVSSVPIALALRILTRC